MDRRRRRYVPGTEGLEGRQLLSAVEVVAAAAPAPAAMVSTQEVSPGPARSHQQAQPQQQEQAEAPLTREQRRQAREEAERKAQQESYDGVVEMRLQRIERLPAFLQLLDPDRALPTEAIAAIQDELRGLVGQLRPPAEPIAEGFVDQLRNSLAQASVNPQTVKAMNFATDRLLNSAGAPQQTITVITDGLTELARTASGSDRPVSVMSNDYALVLQTAMGVGRPISRAELLGLQSPLAPMAPQPGAMRSPMAPGGAPAGGMF